MRELFRRYRGHLRRERGERLLASKVAYLSGAWKKPPFAEFVGAFGVYLAESTPTKTPEDRQREAHEIAEDAMRRGKITGIYGQPVSMN